MKSKNFLTIFILSVLSITAMAKTNSIERPMYTNPAQGYFPEKFSVQPIYSLLNGELLEQQRIMKSLNITIENGSDLEKELNNNILNGASYHIGASSISKEKANFDLISDDNKIVLKISFIPFISGTATIYVSLTNEPHEVQIFNPDLKITILTLLKANIFSTEEKANLESLSKALNNNPHAIDIIKALKSNK